MLPTTRDPIASGLRLQPRRMMGGRALMSDADSLDALTDRSPDGVLWSRVNSAETFPGVLTDHVVGVRALGMACAPASSISGWFKVRDRISGSAARPDSRDLSRPDRGQRRRHPPPHVRAPGRQR